MHILAEERGSRKLEWTEVTELSICRKYGDW